MLLPYPLFDDPCQMLPTYPTLCGGFNHPIPNAVHAQFTPSALLRMLPPSTTTSCLPSLHIFLLPVRITFPTFLQPPPSTPPKRRPLGESEDGKTKTDNTTKAEAEEQIPRWEKGTVQAKKTSYYKGV